MVVRVVTISKGCRRTAHPKAVGPSGHSEPPGDTHGRVPNLLRVSSATSHTSVTGVTYGYRAEWQRPTQGDPARITARRKRAEEE